MSRKLISAPKHCYLSTCTPSHLSTSQSLPSGQVTTQRLKKGKKTILTDFFLNFNSLSTSCSHSQELQWVHLDHSALHGNLSMQDLHPEVSFSARALPREEAPPWTGGCPTRDRGAAGREKRCPGNHLSELQS